MKASNLFPDWEFWLKNGPKSEFLGKLEISGNFAKTFIFLFSMCFKHNNTLLCPNFVEKYWFLKKLEHLQFIRVWPWKNGPKFDDVIGGHVRGPKFENLLFSCSWINFRSCHTKSKDKNYFFAVLFQIEISEGTLCPPPN